MATNIVQLNSEEHKTLRCLVDNRFPHVFDKHMVPIVGSEYLYAASNFPIVFVKESETGAFRSVGLLGLTEGENLIFSADRIETTYVPLSVKREPFYIGGENLENDDLALCIDLNSARINAKDGKALFDNTGKPSEFLESVKAFFADFVTKEIATRAFVQFLVDHELLHASQLTVTLAGGEKHKYGGIYKVNEDKLGNLPEKAVMEMYKNNYFAAVYAHLVSLGQFQRLLKIKASRDAAQRLAS